VIDSRERFDVVVVGGGPVGAALTGDLARRGIRTLLIEQGDGLVKDARMHLVNIRTMEILRNYGLEQNVRQCGWPPDHPQDVLFVTSLDGREIGRISWPSIAAMTPPLHSPTFAQRCPQAWFNPIMLNFARTQVASTLRMNHRFVSMSEDVHGLEVRIFDAQSAREYTVDARYLVGCDGSRSSVRKQLGVSKVDSESIGQSAEVIFRSTDLAAKMSVGRAGRYILVTRRGMSASMLPFDGKDRYRLTLMVQPSQTSAAQMCEEIRSLTRTEFEFELVSAVLPWVNRNVSAARYRVGRVMLAGDAAHGMPPTGGFGMNTGMIDAFDLAWRLEAVVRGWGGGALLDSYDSERRQAVARTSKMASDIYRDWVRWGKELRSLDGDLEGDDASAIERRRRVGSAMVETFAREFNPQGGALGYRYNDSPICIPDGSREPEDTLIHYEQSARPGHRAPHFWLANGRSSLDLFGRGFTLLASSLTASCDDFGRAFGRLRAPLEIVNVGALNALELLRAQFVLVRPDGMVAWRSDTLPVKPDLTARTVTGNADIGTAAD